jgi:hypothetical protein
MEFEESMVEALKKGEDIVATCKKCGEHTFVTDGYVSMAGKIVCPLGRCVQCHDEMRKLDAEKDVELMMEFRSEHWDKWVAFCLESG